MAGLGADLPLLSRIAELTGGQVLGGTPRDAENLFSGAKRRAAHTPSRSPHRCSRWHCCYSPWTSRPGA
jgi:hypothetical protein